MKYVFYMFLVCLAFGMIASVFNAACSEEEKIRTFSYIDANGDSVEYRSYKEALEANDFATANAMIAEAETHGHYRVYGLSSYSWDMDKAKKEIFDKEVKFLAADGSSAACSRLVFLFSDYKLEGHRPDEGMHSDAYYNGRDYSRSVKEYNDRAEMVLNLAISQNNRELSETMLGLFKQNVEIKETGKTNSDGDDIYIISYNWKDKERAQKKFNEHFGIVDNHNSATKTRTSGKKRRR